MAPRRDHRPRVAIIGTRGYPSFYGGFETAVRNVVPFFVDNGWDVDVYGRDQPSATYFDGHVRSRRTRGVESRSLSTITFGLTACLDASARKPDVALIMNVANGFWLPLLRMRRIPTVINVDGIEWERAKWGRLARAVFRMGAKTTARWGDELVFDAEAIGEYWRREFSRDGTYIPYGGTAVKETESAPLGLESGTYILYVARFVPENSVLEFLEAVDLLPPDVPVVIVGSSGYGGPIEEEVERLANARAQTRWLGHVRDDDLLDALWAHCGVYFHGHSVGGTNPALVQAMWAGAPTVARDTVYNREVLGEAGEYVEATAGAIADGLTRVLADDAARERQTRAAQARAEERFSWSGVANRYQELLEARVAR